MTKKVILDTNILMGAKDHDALLSHFDDAQILITLGTLRELDRLKMAEGRRGFEARNGLRFIRNNKDKIEVVHHDKEAPAEDSVDNIISLSAQELGATIITNDLSMASISSSLGLKHETYHQEKDTYRTGFHEVELGEELYEGNNPLLFLGMMIEDKDFRLNEYVIVNEFGFPKHLYKYTATGFEKIENPTINSKVQFGKITAQNNDIYQRCAIDALQSNQINIITGPSGSGKSFLTLAAQWAMLEQGEIEGITIFVNPVKAKNSKEIGFYKGDKNAKLLQEGIGSILAAKLGGGSIEVIEGLILEGKLKILPISDIRGYEVTGNRSLYITEAQNLNVELMKLAIQRAEKCKVFIEGDPLTQLDGWMYEGSNNGMKRAIEVFSGEECFGTVALQNIYRSKIAAIADKM